MGPCATGKNTPPSTPITRWGSRGTRLNKAFECEVGAQMRARGQEVVIFGGRGAPQFRQNPKSKIMPSNEVKGQNPKSAGVRLFPYIDRDLWRKVPLLGRQYTLTKLLERLS